jgi:uncharacterized protein
MKNTQNVSIEYERQDDQAEEGVVVPWERISPDTLRKMVEEFVTRDWSEMPVAGCTLEEMIEQVISNRRMTGPRWCSI